MERGNFQLPSPISELPSPISELPSPISELPSPISELPSPIPELPSPISELPSPISELPTSVSHLRAAISYLPTSIFKVVLAAAVFLPPPSVMAQTNKAAAAEWLAHAPVVPAFAAPANRSAWELKRAEIHGTLWQLLGKLPPRPKVPEVRTFSKEDRGEYRLEKFQFDNGAGATVPGYLLLPKSASPSAKVPGILFCHWHGGDYEIGKEELFQTRHMPEAPGPALVRRGFAVLAIDAYCFGERNGQGPGGAEEKRSDGEMTASKFNLWVGRTLWGMILRDDLMALDYLASRPEVDAGRLGVTGISMGATRTWWLMALDDRLKAGVAVACLTRYQNLIQHEAMKAHGIYYFVPGLLNHFDTEAIVALIAPRPVLFQTGDQDSGSPLDGIHAIDAAVRPVYRLYGKEDSFQSIVYPGLGHVYTPEMWTKTQAWLEKNLTAKER